MTKNQRIVALIIETCFIVLNLSVYFAMADSYIKGFALGVAIVFMCLFILDWNALFKDKEGGEDG